MCYMTFCNGSCNRFEHRCMCTNYFPSLQRHECKDDFDALLKNDEFLCSYTLIEKFADTLIDALLHCVVNLVAWHRLW